MKTFTFEMKTPEGIFLSEEAEYVCLPSSDGRYGILACHAPVILWLDRGMCEYTQNGVKKRVFILEGVADVTGKKVTVLSDFIETEEKAEEALKEREKYFDAEKIRRKESYYEYKQGSIELAKAMKNLSSKMKRINE